ncbi:hypothetical protein [Sulfuricurvum sp.]|uniref:lysozyme inhibitor LprI family protein n=1 Tax=Sulfuricurvum sp. TaxID=2025608 RepID=UPI002E345640|nr:hypothetical protein [Sulfuricurvum sp.]HEX5329708.1 hypothetical protein [Sulfuricurvum sp.]
MKISILAILVMSSVLFGAGFDCAKASNDVENMICENAYLEQLDSILSDTYTAVLKSVPNKHAIKLDQKKWLKNVRDRCNDTDCIDLAYENRITDLSHIWNLQYKRAAAKIHKSDKNPFEGEWKSCQLWRGQEICGSYLFVQENEHICGEWLYWATNGFYEGQLQAKVYAKNRAKNELICGEPGSRTQTPCDNEDESGKSWEKAKGELVVMCGDGIYKDAKQESCRESLKIDGYFYHPLTAKDKNRLLSESWVKKCLNEN